MQLNKGLAGESNVRHFLKSAMVALFIVPGAPVLAATVMTLAPVAGHPNLPVTVSGSGFAGGEAVDIYIDTMDSLLAVSSATGTIKATITIPAAAQPGPHFVTAIGRRSGDAAQAPFTVSTSWAEDGFGAAHLAWNQYENTLSPSVVPLLELLWAAPESTEFGAPTVVNGRVYTGSSANGPGQQGVFALNAATGALVWHKTTAAGEIFYTSAAVAAGVIYIQGSSGILYAFRESGAPLWSTQLGDDGFSAPVVVKGVIYVESGTNVYALNTSGAILWNTATGGDVQAHSVAVGNGRVFATSDDGKLYALNASTGAVLWTYATGAAISSTPAVANGIVYVGSSDDHFYALRAGSGNLVWSVTTPSQVNGSPAVAGGVVYIPSIDGNLHAFNAANGDPVWTVPIPPSSGQVSIADGVVYVGDELGNVNAFDAKNGQYLIAPAAGDIVDGTPVVANGMLFVSSFDGNLYAFAPGGAGADAVRRTSTPPAVSSLHPDMQLAPTR
jgi:outer membrane protein assembly factor BamB